MVMVTMILAYAMAILGSLTIVTAIMRTAIGSSLLGRGVTGGASGYGLAWILTSWDVVFDYYDAAASGLLGVGGFVAIAGTIALLGVWGLNLWTSKGEVLVR